MSDLDVAAMFGAVFGVVAFGWGFFIWRRLRLIQDTPTAKVRSMALGRVEVFGRAQEKAELAAPITGTRCVYYRYKVEERRGSGRNARWATLEKGDSSAWGFYLEDETGQVLVLPERASVEIGVDFRGTNSALASLIQGREHVDAGRWQRFSLFGQREIRLTESRIAAGEAVYVLGVAQERPGLASERRERIAEKLRALKTDPDAMAHFDADGDGSISSDEWDIARQLVVQEVRQEGYDDRIVIAADRNKNAPFYVSDGHEQAIVSRHRWKCIAGIWGGAALNLVCLYFLLFRFGFLGGF